MRCWWLFLLCLPFILSNAALAEWKLSGNADLTAEGMYWAAGPLGPDHDSVRGIYTLRTPVTVKNGREFRLRFLPVVQWDPTNVSKNERFFWTPQEAYAQVSILPWTIQLGYNVQSWGDTDVFNPLDVVNQRRFFDPLRPEKLGAPTLLFKRDFETFFLEALYIPVQPKTLVPGEKSRWLPREYFSSQSLATSFGTAVAHLPNNLNYHYVAPYIDHAALQNNFGGRAKFRLPGFDWTLVGFSGAATAPAVNPRYLRGTLTSISIDSGTQLQILAQPDVFLWADYYRVNMGGTSFVWVMGDFLVKGAAAFTHAVKPDINVVLPTNTQENVLGLERTFSVGEGSLTALVQGTYVNRHQAFENSSVSLAQMFDRAAMTGLRWAPNERWAVLASYLRDIHYKGNLAHGELEHKIADGWKAKISGDYLDGRTETPIGTYRGNSRVFVGLNAQL